MASGALSKAKKVKNDEFYTQTVAIEQEMNAYLDFNRDVFRDKVVLLPCDDPEWSNFTKYFALRFKELGLKKLISTSYAPNSNPAPIDPQPSLFERESEQFDEEKSQANGKVYILTDKDRNNDGVVNIDDLEFSYLEGDGDFRSEEVTALRDEADIVITNPPFSLFREFMVWLERGNVLFSIIGNTNSVTYKEVFPLIKANRMWLGRGFSGGNAYFRVPSEVIADYSEGVYDSEANLVHFRNVEWFTNIDHGRRHQPLQLMTMDDNKMFNKKIIKKGTSYKKYDNCDAIEVPYTNGIPSDWPGVMGVPISFLSKYNPEQFEIIKFRHGDDGKDLSIDGTTPYFRILIRHRKQEGN